MKLTPLAEHRALYREELCIPVNAKRIPEDTEPILIDGHPVDVLDVGDLGGMPLSPSMVRRLGPPEGYGAKYPWAHSWSFLRRACRADHPGHAERPEFGGALCWQLVSWAVVSEYSPRDIAYYLGFPVESVERLLSSALRWIIEDMDRKQRFRNGRNPAPSEEPTPSRLSLLQCDAANRAVADFELEQRIWNSQREIQARHGIALDSWEDEWARRQVVLVEHRQSCERCRRVA